MEPGSESYFAELQVLDMCFTFTTVSVCEPLGALPVEAALEPALDPGAEVVPLISTSWPTCSVNLEVSPAS